MTSPRHRDERYVHWSWYSIRLCLIAIHFSITHDIWMGSCVHSCRAKVKRFRKSTRNEAKESSCPEEKDRKKMSPKNKDKVSETEKSHRGIKERVKSKHKEKGKVNQGKGRERHKKRKNTEKRDVQSVSVPLLSEQKGRCSPQASMISSVRKSLVGNRSHFQCWFLALTIFSFLPWCRTGWAHQGDYCVFIAMVDNDIDVLVPPSDCHTL